MIQRSGELAIRMLANVQQVTIEPIMRATIAVGTVVYTDEYEICVTQWGFEHHTVNHGNKEYSQHRGFKMELPNWDPNITSF
jgi:hypothetical protein